jgi:hypothetical protein
MNSPANRLAHRHRAAAAGTDITLVGVRRGGFTRSKIAVNDLIVGVAPQAAAERAFGANDLFAFACDQHPGAPRCTRSAGTVNPSGDSMYPIIDSMYPIIVQFRHRPHRLVTEVPETLAILYGADLSGALLVFTKLSRATPTA